MKPISLILTGFALCCLVSCSHNYYKSPVFLSTKSVSLPQYEVLEKIEKKSCKTETIFSNTNVLFDKMNEDVMEEAKKLGGDAVLDFHLRETSNINTVFYSSQCFVATGTAIKYVEKK